MIHVGDQMNLSVDVLILLLDAELYFLSLDQALGQGAAFDNAIVIAPLEDVRTGQPVEPGIFLRAIKPGVKRRARAGEKIGFLVGSEILFGHVRFAHARIENQLVLLVLPDGALDVERRAAGNRCPAVAPIVAEESHVQMAQGKTGGGERYRQQAPDLGRFVPLVDHLVQALCDFGPAIHVRASTEFAAPRDRRICCELYMSALKRLSNHERVTALSSSNIPSCLKTRGVLRQRAGQTERFKND